jgi:hypothetical protein
MNSDPSMVAQDETVVIAKGVGQASQIYFERLEKHSGRDTGWFIGTVEGAETTYEFVPVGNLLTSRPDFRELLSLPKGTLVVMDAAVMDGAGVTAVLDSGDQDIWAKAVAEAANAEAAEAESAKAAEAEAMMKEAKAAGGGLAP